MSDDEYYEGDGDYVDGYDDNEGGGYDDNDGGGYDGDNQEYYGDQGGYEQEEFGGYEDENPPEEDQQVEYNEAYNEPEDEGYQQQEEEQPQEEQAYHQESNYADVEQPHSTGGGLEFGGFVKDAMDGFGGGSIHDVVDSIQNIAGGSGGLTNILASGGLETIAAGLIATAAHKFFNVNPETGRIIGAIAGNVIFQLGGKHNSLSDIGKIVLDNIVSGKYKRKVDPFISPTPGVKSFNLDFNTERQRCLAEKRLFEDPEFPANESSLYFSQRPKMSIEWKRPAEIVNDPQLIVGGESRFDVKQGALGDCWLLAATANLTLREELFYRVVPPDQSFTENYAGIFHFQFWRYGKWVDVVVDDLLPTHNGELVYMHSQDHNEFWSALLEKAYAKLYGSYEALKGGFTSDAMEDFTGGLIEDYDIKELPKEHLLALMVRGFQMGSLFGCSIDADPEVTEARCDNGLVRGHAYSITALQTVSGPRGMTPILRVRNPWGNDTEWNGAWCDGAPEWDYVSYEDRHKMQVVFKADGEFWMSFDDFVRNFEKLEQCNLGPAVMNEIAEMTGVAQVADSAWTEFQADGQWLSAQGTAGGCKNNPSYPNNPQYGAKLSVGTNTVEADGKATVIVALLQKYRRELRVSGLDNLAIGFAVYELPSPRRQQEDYLKHAHTIAKNPVFINSREVTARFRVPPGEYLIIPSTFEPNEDAEFLLRIYTSGQVEAG
ncbi:unnamed protein product [Bursaphelenchus okinawaensis]|uniref:Calpain catalytic domain-containing protein n=1 Tax=Bursaphelenchus okinawaensis TaxID=465554 RepID=A0A811KWW7_9BILA|nr:unnamed protein product [Bursaphelenchus okinawaensis]CAG9113061.1 unnamed protein product [Bursaphelenchus okinawaensis]